MLCYDVSCDVMLCYVMLCYVICYVLMYQFMVCHNKLCNVIKAISIVVITTNIIYITTTITNNIPIKQITKRAKSVKSV
jgi:hypothetical protein